MKWAEQVNKRMIAPAEDEQEEGEITIEDGETELEPVKMAPDPGQPTAKQLEDHRRVHLPYRLWCKWCVMGRGRGFPHKKSPGSLIAIIGLDYFYITSGGVKRRDELTHAQDNEGDAELETSRAKGDIVKCIVVRCSLTKAVFGHVVPQKGVDEDNYVAGVVTDDIAWLGHTKVMLKSDNEHAMQSLVRRVVDVSRADCKDLKSIAKEESAAYDSQSNGSTEVGIRLIRGLFRTTKLCLEARLDKLIPITHALVPWILEHTALLLNVLVRGDDGLTAWARARGRPFAQQMLGIAEAVLYKLPSKGPRNSPDGNMGTRWREGIFLGYSRTSNTYIIGTPDGIEKARSMTRKPLDQRWKPEGLAEIKATPWSEREVREPRVRFQQPAEDPGPPVETAAPAAPRALRINKSDLEEHGFTDGCTQCDYIQRYGKARPGRTHSVVCRARLVEAIKQSETGRDRFERHEERTTRAIAERIEHECGPEDRRRGIIRPREGDEPVAAPRPAPAREGADHPHDGREVLGGGHKPDGEHRRPAPGGAERSDVTGARRVPSDEAANAETSPSRASAGDQTMEEVFGPQELLPPMEETFGPQEPVSKDHEDADMEGDDGEANEDATMDFIGSLEPTCDDVISEILLQELGSSRSYRREKRKAMKRTIVSEIYSSPRVTKELQRMRYKHLAPGLALDLTVVDPHDGMPWDFDKAEKRERAIMLMRRQKPYVLIGSPACKAFSTWQFLNALKCRDPEAMKRAKIQATLHLDFVASLYREQLEGGRYFLHEHPAGATPWQVPSIDELTQIPGVEKVIGDQCQYGAEIQRGPRRGDPVKKPSGFLTNSPEIAKALSKRCQGRDDFCSRDKGGRHRHCEGIRARDAAIHPRDLCRTMLKGVSAQMKADNLLKPGCYGVQVPDDDAAVLNEIYGPAQGYSGKYRDDLTGQVLRDDLVKQARAKELAYFHSKGVWIKVPKQEARAKTGRPPISVRWVDVNKGDEIALNYRSRLVARQMKAMDSSGQSYFAPAPPLEALRTVLSMAVTAIGKHVPDWKPDSPNRTQLSFVDVSRAYFNAAINEHDAPTYVDLPSEDGDAATMCARLLRHMYGTRMAADGWQEEYSSMLIGLGFKQGTACPNAFHHVDKDIVCSVHGDDFTSCGPKPALDWLEKSIAEKYEITIGPRLGPGAGDAKEGRALNRIVRWCDDCIEYEADPRQAERLVAECGLEGSKAVATPGVKATFKELEEDTALPKDLHTAFRSAAARGNYLAADRIDGQFACKEICRSMASPTQHAWKALKRFCRYLNGVPRLSYRFEQQSVSGIDVYADTDWAGCPRTRKSTSGGCVMLGKHAMKHWSSTQTSVALSSGEAEFAGVIRGAGQGLGYQALLRDLGVDAPLRVWTDSSTAIGICSRQGPGKMRHLDTHTLWIQQAVRTGRVDLRKVLGEENPADLLTKHSLSRARIEMLVELFGCRYLEGRAASAPLLRRSGSTKTTMARTGRDVDPVGGDADDLATVPAVGGVDDGNPGGTPPFMPHTRFSGPELDARYPRLGAPEDVLDDVVQADRDDHLLEKGMSIAKEIQRCAVEYGRLRHNCEEPAHTKKTLSPTQPTPRRTTSDPNANTVSVTDRRRSV